MKNGYRIIELGKDKYKTLPQKIMNEIVDVAFDAFGPGMTIEEVLEHVCGTDILYIAYKDKEIQGFATNTIKPEVVYLCGVAVMKKAQGNGIYKAMAHRAIDQALKHKKNTIEFYTQNPKIELGMRQSLDSVVEVELILGYSVDKKIKRKHCGRMLNEKKPMCGEEEIDKKYGELNYDEGDSFNFKFYLEMAK